MVLKCGLDIPSGSLWGPDYFHDNSKLFEVFILIVPWMCSEVSRSDTLYDGCSNRLNSEEDVKTIIFPIKEDI